MGDATPTLMWINRKWVFALTNGILALDWGEGMAQDLITGAFICYTPEEYGHLLDEDELTTLISDGRVSQFNADQAAIYAWPSR